MGLIDITAQSDLGFLLTSFFFLLLPGGPGSQALPIVLSKAVKYCLKLEGLSY